MIFAQLFFVVPLLRLENRFVRNRHLRPVSGAANRIDKSGEGRDARIESHSRVMQHQVDGGVLDACLPRQRPLDKGLACGTRHARN